MVAGNILNSFKKFYIISTFQGFIIYLELRNPENVGFCTAFHLNALKCDSYTYHVAQHVLRVIHYPLNLYCLMQDM
jgi:hypothetical protein